MLGSQPVILAMLSTASTSFKAWLSHKKGCVAFLRVSPVIEWSSVCGLLGAVFSSVFSFFFLFFLGCHQLFSSFLFWPFSLRLNSTFFDSVLFFFLKAGETRGYERAHNTAKHASAIKRWWKSLNDRAATRLQPVFTSASTFCRRLLIWVCVSVNLCLLSPTFSYTVALEMEFQWQNSMFFRRHRYMHSKSKTFFFLVQ